MVIEHINLEERQDDTRQIEQKTVTHYITVKKFYAKTFSSGLVHSVFS